MAVMRPKPFSRPLAPIPRLSALLAACLLAAACAAPPELPRKHMVAAANPLAAAAGLETLRQGGGAVDAAVSVQAVLSLVEPQSSGIGGGAYMLHYRNRDRRIDAYDGRETAPAAAHPDMFLDTSGRPLPFDLAGAGGLPVGVPGVLRMLALAHAEHGKLPWTVLFARAIALAENGFPVSPRLHDAIGSTKDLSAFPAARSYFFDDAGKPLRAGTALRNPELAATFREVAEKGSDAFYLGQIASDIVGAVRNAAVRPGALAGNDMARYAAKKRTALCRDYRAWTVCGMPPSSSGGIATLQILGLLEPFDLGALAPSSAAAIHLISEASRLAYADRSLYVADSDFVPVPVEGLLDRAYLRRRGEAISAAESMGPALPGTPPSVPARADFAPSESRENASTSHFSIVDGDGNAISMTTSIERVFGSRLMVRGFLLNNQLTDFAFEPERDGRRVANAPAPGKRPRSSMSPTLVLDSEGRFYAAIGSPGGSRIVGYVAKALIGLLDWHLPMQAAIDLPNHVNRNGATELEGGTALTDEADTLRRLGHEASIRRLVSGLHGIRATEYGYDGGADRRREGVAIGD
jgi:gamma-glutamyltranspeptidase/glutathione hydrolase